MFVLCLGVWSAVQVQAQTDPMQDPDVKLAKLLAMHAVGSLSSELHYPVLVKVVQRSDLSPLLSVVSSQRECLLVVNTNPPAWSAWERFRNVSGMTEIQSLMFAALHEIGHCENRLGREDSSAVIPPGPESELNADLYAVEKFKELYGPEMARDLADHLVQGRQKYGSSWFYSASHDIARQLRNALSELLQSS